MSNKYTVMENYQVFKEQLSDLTEKHEGKFAVFSNLQLCKIFEKKDEAFEFARANYEGGQYIVQEIISEIPRPISYSLLI